MAGKIICFYGPWLPVGYVSHNQRVALGGSANMKQSPSVVILQDGSNKLRKWPKDVISGYLLHSHCENHHAIKNGKPSINRLGPGLFSHGELLVTVITRPGHINCSAGCFLLQVWRWSSVARIAGGEPTRSHGFRSLENPPTKRVLDAIRTPGESGDKIRFMGSKWGGNRDTLW